jgi:hypothetical protein
VQHLGYSISTRTLFFQTPRRGLLLGLKHNIIAKHPANHIFYDRCSPPVLKPRRRPNPLCKLIPFRKTKRSTTDPTTRPSTTKADSLKAGASIRCEILDPGITYVARSRKGLTTFGCSECHILFDSLFISHLSCFLDTFGSGSLCMHVFVQPQSSFHVSLYTFFFSTLHVHVCLGNEK